MLGVKYPNDVAGDVAQGLVRVSGATLLVSLPKKD